jgi:hypothetical protein
VAVQNLYSENANSFSQKNERRLRRTIVKIEHVIPSSPATFPHNFQHKNQSR